MKLVIGIAAVVVMTISAQSAHAEQIFIKREGDFVTVLRGGTGKPAPQPSQTYIHDSSGNLYDPVTGRPKGRNY